MTLTLTLPSMSLLQGKVRRTGRSIEIDPTLAVIILIGLICLVAPFDLSQLLLMIVGAIAYAATQGMPKPAATRAAAKKMVATTKDVPCVARLPRCTSPAALKKERCMSKSSSSSSSSNQGSEGRPAVRTTPKHHQRQQFQQQQHTAGVVTPKFQPSSVPVSAPQFSAANFDGQVEELLGQIATTPSSEETVMRLAEHVKRVLQSLVPEVEVTGCVTGDLSRGNAFGVAVPEVDIVANINPAVLARRLQERLTRGGLEGRTPTGALPFDARKLQKSAIRACTDLLVASGGFKFRRSAFRSQEPKVTLLAPPSFSEQAFPMDFSVNCVMPLYNAALLAECGKIETRAKALMLFVRRWAKDRGVCHAARGHLPPYAWSLLVIYFLQVRNAGKGRLLPPVGKFEISKQLMARSQSPQTKPADEKYKSGGGSGDGSEETVAELFREFVNFYNSEVNWHKEAVSVRLGSRQPPSSNIDIHIVITDDGRADVAPTIEDPFEVNRNLGACFTEMSLERMRTEIRRAVELSSTGASVSELLEPWKPEQAAEAGEMVTKQKSSEDDDDAE